MSTKLMKFVVEVRIDADNKKGVEKAVAEILQEVIYTGCIASDYQYEAVKTYPKGSFVFQHIKPKI